MDKKSFENFVKMELDPFAQLVAEGAREKIQAVVDQLAGTDFGSLDENVAVAKLVQQQLVRFNLRARCPQCGYPACLRCCQAGRSRHGSFRFGHTIKGGTLTHHASSAKFPAFQIIVATNTAIDEKIRKKKK